MRPLRSLRSRASAGLFLIAFACAGTAARADWFPSDQTVYRVFQQDHLLGTENVTFEQRGDSSCVLSTIEQLLPRPGTAPDTLRKTGVLILAAADGDLRAYQSGETYNDEQTSRVISMADTTYMSYRQDSHGGFGDAFSRPPGRIYIVDPQVFSLFDVIGRDMHSQRFTERRITMLYIAGRDTTVDGHVTRMGNETIKVDAVSISAEKFRLVDPWSEFFLWTDAQGRMVRLTLPAVGLRVDRDPETLKAGHVMSSIKPPPAGMPQVFMQPAASRKKPTSPLVTPERPASEPPGR